LAFVAFSHFPNELSFNTLLSSTSQGERSFFLQPGEHLEEGIQDVYILSEEEGLVLRAVEGTQMHLGQIQRRS
jgi:hypothetical protein